MLEALTGLGPDKRDVEEQRLLSARVVNESMPQDGFLFARCKSLVGRLRHSIHWHVKTPGTRMRLVAKKELGYIGAEGISYSAMFDRMRAMIRGTFDVRQNLRWRVTLNPLVSDDAFICIEDIDWCNRVTACRRACILFISKKVLSSLPRDVRWLLARTLWQSRADHAWTPLQIENDNDSPPEAKRMKVQEEGQ